MDISYSVDEALAIADRLGYPVVLRPAYTMGGAGGGLVYNKEELKTVCARGLAASLVGQVLVEESILGWEELELEIVRVASPCTPITCTLYFSSTPSFASSAHKFRPDCPPRFGSSASGRSFAIICSRRFTLSGSM